MSSELKDETELIGQRGKESNPGSGTARAKGQWWDRHGELVGQKDQCGCSTDGERQNGKMSLKECPRPFLPCKEFIPYLTRNLKLMKGTNNRSAFLKGPRAAL